ncbi:MAG: NAD(P)H-hydrate dehydratase, partial [Clostridia bacterium]|nr:NAD(P)H-hydrate dehydratase [Clostridia bacterium]
GAAVLAAKAALRSGVGLVTCAFPDCLYQTMTAKLTESLFMPLEGNADGTLGASCIETLVASLDKFDAILIGCGLGVNEDTEAVLKAVLENAKVPVVADADALNIISANKQLLENVSAPVILTPHPGEMSRLTGVQAKLIQADRVACAGQFAKEYGVYVVLKGSNTVVASPDSDRVYVNASGNNGLSKGGSGDVLAGILSAFCARGLRPVDAADAAVYIHGYCADVLADRYSKIGILPSDVIDELREIFADFE